MVIRKSAEFYEVLMVSLILEWLSWSPYTMLCQNFLSVVVLVFLRTLLSCFYFYMCNSGGFFSEYLLVNVCMSLPCLSDRELEVFVQVFRISCIGRAAGSSGMVQRAVKLLLESLALLSSLKHILSYLNQVACLLHNDSTWKFFLPVVRCCWTF